MKTNNSDFWKKKRVLVTGYGGFVGTALAGELVEAGAEIFAVSKKNITKNTGFQNLHLEVCDLSDSVQVEKLLVKVKPDIIFHLAGFAIVGEALLRPVKTFEDNFITTLNILDSMRRNKLDNFILASSDKVYGHHAEKEQEGLPFEEGYGLRGLDIYSSSKVCSDVVTRAFAYQYGIKVAVARCCNIYGPGDVNFSRLIPRTAMLLLLGSSPQIKAGHENILREYIYIGDVVRAYKLIAENLESYYGLGLQNMPKQGISTVSWPVFNIGSYSKKDLAEIKSCLNIKSVAEVIGVLRKKITDIQPKILAKRPDYIEIPDEYSDSTKLISLGFQSEFDFEEGINKTISWYRENLVEFKKIFKEQHVFSRKVKK